MQSLAARRHAAQPGVWRAGEALRCAPVMRRASPRRAGAPSAAQAATAVQQLSGTVSVDNSCDPHHTVLRVEADDFSGLIRALAWTLTGLGLSVANALIETHCGRAHDVFYVTDLRGRKLSDARAHDVAERLQLIVDDACKAPGGGEFTEASVGPSIRLSNVSHPSCTELTVTPDVDSPGLLLNIASVIHGMGISVTQGVIRSPGPLAPAGGGAVSSGDDAGTIAAVAPAAAGRVMRFHLQEARSGRKLDYESASGLLLALQLVSGRGAPTALPTVSRANDCGCS